MNKQIFFFVFLIVSLYELKAAELENNSSLLQPISMQRVSTPAIPIAITPVRERNARNNQNHAPQTQSHRNFIPSTLPQFQAQNHSIMRRIGTLCGHLSRPNQ